MIPARATWLDLFKAVFSPAPPQVNYRTENERLRALLDATQHQLVLSEREVARLLCQVDRNRKASSR